MPTSGGLAKTLKSARELGCETVQIFVSNPQGWADPVPRRDADVLVEGTRELGVSPVVAHAKYLINLASKNEELRDRSVRALAHELVAAGTLGVDLVVVHAGSHGGDGEEVGMDRLVDGLGRAREQAAELDGASGVAEAVVENSVGAGTQLCSTFDALGEVARRAGVRVCVDTAHAFVAGYDLSSEDEGKGGRLRAGRFRRGCRRPNPLERCEKRVREPSRRASKGGGGAHLHRGLARAFRWSARGSRGHGDAIPDSAG